MPFVSINPATAQEIRRYPSLSAQQLGEMLLKASQAFAAWSSETVESRCAVLARVAEEIRRQRDALARLATAEMGKPIRQSLQEVDKCADSATYLAAHASKWLAEESRPIDTGQAAVRFEPLGVILAVMPWNFPYWQIVRMAIGALAAGNAVLVKPAPSTAGCALALEACFRAAGISEGAYSTALAEVDQLEAVVSHRAVAAVSLTGSVGAGRSLAILAARHGKPAVLELGGSDPFVIFDDADPAVAGKAAAQARCLNSGQSCIAAKRFIATAGIYPAFRDAFVAATKTLKVADPLLPDTDVGPLARSDLRDVLTRQWRAAVTGGAKPLCGGGPREGQGFYFTPEVLELSTPAGPAWREETFGPLAALIGARDENHAIELANDTMFGLGCNLFTNDVDRARSLVPRLRAGNVFINGAVKSIPGLPFGGVLDSGYGRELGVEGVRQFTNIKTVVIA